MITQAHAGTAERRGRLAGTHTRPAGRVRLEALDSSAVVAIQRTAGNQAAIAAISKMAPGKDDVVNVWRQAARAMVVHDWQNAGPLYEKAAELVLVSGTYQDKGPMFMANAGWAYQQAGKRHQAAVNYQGAIAAGGRFGQWAIRAFAELEGGDKDVVPSMPKKADKAVRKELGKAAEELASGDTFQARSDYLDLLIRSGMTAEVKATAALGVAKVEKLLGNWDAVKRYADLALHFGGGWKNDADAMDLTDEASKHVK